MASNDVWSYGTASLYGLTCDSRCRHRAAVPGYVRRQGAVWKLQVDAEFFSRAHKVADVLEHDVGMVSPDAKRKTECPHLWVDGHLSPVHVVEEQLHDVDLGVLDGDERVGAMGDPGSRTIRLNRGGGRSRVGCLGCHSHFVSVLWK